MLTVRAGDVVVVPAGVAHCNQGQSNDLLIVGAYPENGPSPDLRRGKPEEHDAAKLAVEGVPLPAKDPIGSINGALPQLWAREEKRHAKADFDVGARRSSGVDWH
jgi:uncharacterized protein YjlB